MYLLEADSSECLLVQLNAEQVAVVASCQSAGSPTLKHPLLYGLFDAKWDHNLLNEHHAVLKKT